LGFLVEVLENWLHFEELEELVMVSSSSKIKIGVKIGI
jgi:hypothetical protein